MSPGCVGCQPVSSRVSVLEAGMSSARNWASQEKGPAASSGAMDTTGRERCRPICIRRALEVAREGSS